MTKSKKATIAGIGDQIEAARRGVKPRPAEEEVEEEVEYVYEEDEEGSEEEGSEEEEEVEVDLGNLVTEVVEAVVADSSPPSANAAEEQAAAEEVAAKAGFLQRMWRRWWVVTSAAIERCWVTIVEEPCVVGSMVVLGMFAGHLFGVAQHYGADRAMVARSVEVQPFGENGEGARLTFHGPTAGRTMRWSPRITEFEVLVTPDYYVEVIPLAQKEQLRRQLALETNQAVAAAYDRQIQFLENWKLERIAAAAKVSRSGISNVAKSAKPATAPKAKPAAKEKSWYVFW